MSNYRMAPEGKDPQIWQLAQKRADFKRHFMIYLAVNAMFWLLWIMGSQHDHRGLPWPVYPGIGWGIGVLFHYMGAYASPESDQVEKEYNKLMNRKQS